MLYKIEYKLLKNVRSSLIYAEDKDSAIQKFYNHPRTTKNEFLLISISENSTYDNVVAEPIVKQKEKIKIKKRKNIRKKCVQEPEFYFSMEKRCKKNKKEDNHSTCKEKKRKYKYDIIFEQMRKDIYSAYSVL